jgi:hypothetical protein
MRVFTTTRAIVVSVVTLATIASCAAAPSSSALSDAPSVTATAAGPKATAVSSSSPSATPELLLGPILDIAAPCHPDRAYVTADTVVWQACDLRDPHPTSQIYEYSRRTARTRLLYESLVRGMTIVGVSEEWVVWFEYADISTARDSKLYALPRTGGARITIDDPLDHPDLANLADATLDGSDVYWTVPRIENGAWHGALLRRRLPDGAAAVVVQAPVGAVIGYPSVHDGAVAFEYSVQTGTPKTTVRFLSPSGTQRDLGVAPSSEPAFGDGFIVFKMAERYEVGELGSFALVTGAVTALGPGEQPHAEGPFVTWMSSAPLSGGIRIGRPLDNCIVERPPGSSNTDSLPSLGSGYFAWAFRDDARPAAEARRFRIAKIQSVRC